MADMNGFDVGPDWSEIRTATRFSQDFTKFKFKGTGWYFAKDGDVLLVEDAVTSGKVGAPENKEPVYLFSVWNGRNPFQIFAKMLALPVRTVG